MAVIDGKGIAVLDYLNVESHPRCNSQMSNTAKSFCNSLGEEGTVIRNLMVGFGDNDLLPANGQWAIRIYAEMVIKPNCQLVISKQQCERYFGIVTDSCNCEGADRKQGGTLRMGVISSVWIPILLDK
ncbi:hypothetical protein PspLS_08450 [Pyricularia sp. CBS 133598]|nr:hypothetical protein PspLS_08450 [Pyricularia sp. CBS 133598]